MSDWPLRASARVGTEFALLVMQRFHGMCMRLGKTCAASCERDEMEREREREGERERERERKRERGRERERERKREREREK